MRYKDSVEDRVHTLLSERLEGIYTVFVQIPDVLEDAWILVAEGQQERARLIIDGVPKEHPFTLRYTKVENVHWESCIEVLYDEEKLKVLSKGWR